jgi:hypothetical protein
MPVIDVNDGQHSQKQEERDLPDDRLVIQQSLPVKVEALFFLLLDSTSYFGFIVFRVWVLLYLYVVFLVLCLLFYSTASFQFYSIFFPLLSIWRCATRVIFQLFSRGHNGFFIYQF